MPPYTPSTISIRPYLNVWAWRLLLRHWLFFFGLLTVMRLAFFLVYRETFAGLGAGAIAGAFLHGVRFDLATVFALSGVPSLALFLLSPLSARVWIYRAFLGLMWAVTGLVGLLLAMDLYYFPHVGRRISFEAVAMFSEWRPILAMALRGYTLPVAVAALLFTALVAYTTRPALRLARQARRPATWWAQGLQALALALAVVLIGRGGWQSKPLSVDMAFRGPDMALGHLTLNAAFTTAHAAAARRHSLLEYYPDAQAQGRVRRLLGLQGPPDDPGYPLAQQPVHRQPDTQQPVHRQPDTQQEPSAAPVRPPNLVMIVLESFSTQLVGALGGPPGLTPNLDRLAGEGVLFTEFFAAGTRSIEGIAAILTGYPALPHSQLIGSPLAQNNLQSLPRILRSRGYQMLFLHGAFRGSMWFDHFASLHGFQRYIAQEDFEDYPSKSDGAWGIFDHHALERLNRELEQTPGPVFAFFFSLSSHTPYALPEGTPRKFGPEIPQADMLNSYAYTDQALGRFFERARQSDSWRNTIFVVTADHNKGEREYSPLERMRVPLLIIAPGLEGLEPGSRSDAPGSHLDIAPTVLDLLGLSAPHNFLGRPLLPGPGSGAGIAPREFRAMLSWGGQAGWLTGEMLLTHDLKKPLGLFNWRQDPALKHNLLAGGGPGGSAVVVAGSDPVAEFQSYLQTTNNLLLTNRVFPARWLQESGRSPAAAR